MYNTSICYPSDRKCMGLFIKVKTFDLYSTSLFLITLVLHHVMMPFFLRAIKKKSLVR